VHGEAKVQEAFKLKIQDKGFVSVEIPERHQEYILD
jgi:hypothetical protein